MKKLIIISSLLIVVLIGCSESENDNIINNVEEINKEKPIYFYDVNPMEFLGVWELKKDSMIKSPSWKFKGNLWKLQKTPQKIEFNIDTAYIANTTLIVYNYNDTILYRYWKYRGFFIEASKFQPNRHPLPNGGTNTYNEYTLAIVDYDENNLIIHSFIGNFFQLEYEKTIDYDIDENILELKKHYN